MQFPPISLSVMPHYPRAGMKVLLHSAFGEEFRMRVDIRAGEGASHIFFLWYLAELVWLLSKRFLPCYAASCLLSKEYGLCCGFLFVPIAISRWSAFSASSLGHVSVSGLW